MEDTNNILEIEDLSIHYVLDDETVEAVNNVSLKLQKGKVLGLVGETGAGKTTLGLACMRLIPNPPGKVISGKIRVNGIDTFSLPENQMNNVRGKEISMIFQDPMTSLNPAFTVGEQIAEGVQIHEGLDKHDAFKRAQEMLELVGIPANRAGEYPHQFSGGMRQRVVIAIALTCNPKLLIADEPTTALDVTIQAQVLEMMKELIEKYQTSVVMITHDLGIVADICDEVAVMYAGSIVERGTLEDIFLNTMHPYTEGLFNSLPDITHRGEDLHPIPGLMPDPTNLPKGCAFAPRCAYATDACRQQRPKLKAFSETHLVACSGYEKEGFRIERSKPHE